MNKLFTLFSFPGGNSSDVLATAPGSIHQRGELGYSLSHTFGAVFNNPRLVIACAIGDDEAKTDHLATAWHSTKFLNLVSDGTVPPILLRTGYTIRNPRVLAGIDLEALDSFLRGYGWDPLFVEGDDPETMYQLLSSVLDEAIADVRDLQSEAPDGVRASRPRWPMIVLRSSKGWADPTAADGLHVEGTFQAHQVPLLVEASHPGNVEALEEWIGSYKSEGIFDAKGRVLPALTALPPCSGHRRTATSARRHQGLSQTRHGQQAYRAQALHQPARSGLARDPRLGVDTMEMITAPPIVMPEAGSLPAANRDARGGTCIHCEQAGDHHEY